MTSIPVPPASPDDSDDVNDVLRDASRRMWTHAFVSTLLTGFCFFFWAQLFSRSKDFGFDLAAILGRVTEEVDAGDLEPAGVLGAFGTVAIALAVALLENSRRLESLDHRSRAPLTDAAKRTLAHQIHTSQIASLLEFFLTVLAAGLAALLTLSFIADHRSVLSGIGGLLLLLLCIGAWRFLLVFDSLKHLQPQPPRARLAERLNALCSQSRWQRSVGVVWWLTMSAVFTGLALDACFASSASPGQSFAICILFGLSLLGTAWASRVYARSAVHEFGWTRPITITISAMMTLPIGVLTPYITLLSTHGKHDTILLPLIPTLLLWFAVALVLWRVLDRGGWPARFSSAGSPLVALLRRPKPVPSRADSIRSILWCVSGSVAIVVAVGIPVGIGTAGTEWMLPAAAAGVAAVIGSLWVMVTNARWAPRLQKRTTHVLALLVSLGVYLVISLFAASTAELAQVLVVLAALVWLFGTTVPLASIIFTPQQTSTWLTDAMDRRQARSSALYRRYLSSVGIHTETRDERALFIERSPAPESGEPEGAAAWSV